MITILWLIRSNQGVLEKGGETFWQDDWFLALLVTFLSLVGDFLFLCIFLQITRSL